MKLARDIVEHTGQPVGLDKMVNHGVAKKFSYTHTCSGGNAETHRFARNHQNCVVLIVISTDEDRELSAIGEIWVSGKRKHAVFFSDFDRYGVHIIKRVRKSLQQEVLSQYRLMRDTVGAI